MGADGVIMTGSEKLSECQNMRNFIYRIIQLILKNNLLHKKLNKKYCNKHFHFTYTLAQKYFVHKF